MPAKRKIVLTNSFHGTAVRLILLDGQTLSPGQVRRARRVLCGVAGCGCCGVVGERGPQWQEDGRRIVIDEATLRYRRAHVWDA